MMPTPTLLAGVPVEPGSHIVHHLHAATTHGGFDVAAQLHLLCGATPGPTLVVHAGMSGLEIEPALTLPRWLRSIDPRSLRGNLIVAPLFNLSGFEFETIEAAWDGADLNALGAGRVDGTVSEQLIHAYASTVLEQADAVIDLRTGAQWGYYRYAGVHDVGGSERIEASLALAASLGLPHAALGEPVGSTLAGAMAARGVTWVTAWLGGGPGLRDHREADSEALEHLMDGALAHLGMSDGSPPDPARRLRIHTFLRPEAQRGLTFMDTGLRGSQVSAGTELGVVRHPFEGHVVRSVLAKRDGIVLHAGASWPVVPEGSTLAILADPL